MPIVDLFSSRQKTAQPASDVWVYDRIPEKLRVQVSNIVRDALGPARDYGDSSDPIYAVIRDAVAHEHGRSHLGGALDQYERPPVQVLACIVSEQDRRIGTGQQLAPALYTNGAGAFRLPPSRRQKMSPDRGGAPPCH
jgi:hypothetical protein